MSDSIDDPFVGFNELDCQWVGCKTWQYRTTLPPVSSSAISTKTRRVLAFDGLDTYATVKINGHVVLQSDNMFVLHRVDIADMLREAEPNVVQIDFQPALLESRKIKEAYPEHKWVGSNGDMARLAARKAQYHYGWDWGPVLMTCGPWRPVRLEVYEARVEDLRVDYNIEQCLERIRGCITANVEGSGSCVTFKASLNDKKVFEAVADIDEDGKARVEFYINEAKLWYPRGYGEQTLYDISATVSCSEGRELHTLSKRTGFRRGELVQEPDQFGKSFYFRFNDVDVFCGGANWIPADSFTPRVGKDSYRKYLETMADGHQIMVRVWGGGIWEEDCFYELCDELGLLVWQDFMFTCGNYPTFPDLLRSIEKECHCQTKRLRHHPSLAIYAGNNEDYQIQEQFGLTYDHADNDPQSWLKTDFPARYIYEKVSVTRAAVGIPADRVQLLPDVVALSSPHVPYHPGSPWGEGKRTSDPTVGDLHQWNVWHGTQEKYQVFDKLGGRFNSEFGMEAFPHLDTIQRYVTSSSELYPQSRQIEFHNKAAGHARRIVTYLAENFRMETDLQKFIHLTQLSQAEALMYAYRGWRRQWGESRRCGGALVWQLNDCWPGTSWSIVDHFQRRKPAYYAIKRALAPLAVGVKRTHYDWSVSHARRPSTSRYECWVASSKVADVVADVEIRFISIASGTDVKERVVKENVRILANGTTQILRGIIDNVGEEPHVVAARLWIEKQVVARDVDWPQPFKYLDFGNRGVHVAQEGHELRVTAARPTKGLVVEERDGVCLSDSALDVVPGDEQIVRVDGLGNNGKRLGWTYLGAG